MQKGLNPRLLFAMFFAVMTGLVMYAGMLGLHYLDVVEWRTERFVPPIFGAVVALIAVAYYRYSKKSKSLYQQLLQQLEDYEPLNSEFYVRLKGFVRMGRYSLYEVRDWTALEKALVEYSVDDGTLLDLNPFNAKPGI